ncbi:beta-galactosidase, partial [bacterium]
DHWGGKHHLGETSRVLDEIGSMFRSGASFSIYMFHGGTSFGFGSGANCHDAYAPQTTSYDYDAPLDEAGRTTPKFLALREILGAGNPDLPPIPGHHPIIEIPEIQLTESVSLFDTMSTPTRSAMPLSMEALGQQNGCVLYRTQIPPYSKGKLIIDELHDYGQVFINGQRIGTLDRRLKENSLLIDPQDSDDLLTLDILVEAMGRVNYGPNILDRKGITQRVILEDVYTVSLMGWEIFSLPLDEDHLASLNFGSAEVSGPAFHRGTFTLGETGDTFLDMSHWNKGFVWVNGYNLGRFWEVGPQQTLYIPGVWLREGENEIVVFDLESSGRESLQALSEPILDQLLTPETASARAS